MFKRFSGYDPNYLYKLNSFHRSYGRDVEKNRFPIKCSCAVCGHGFECRGIEEYLQRQYYLGPDKDGKVRHVCWGCELQNKVKIAAGTLFHLIGGIPRADRDLLEIYPADFATAPIPLALQSNWDWRQFEEWEREGVVLCGMTAESATGRDSQRLRDYSEGTRLLNKFGQYEFAYRQKAASQVWFGGDNQAALWSLEQQMTPDEQWTLKRIGRLYKNSCWSDAWRRSPAPFDKCEASSWKAQSWNPANARIELEPPDELKFAKKERAEMFRVAKSGGHVQILGSPAKRHANLAATQADYNERWGSYTNNNGLGRELRKLGSLNIPREAIEARNNMIANLERDFGPGDEAEAA